MTTDNQTRDQYTGRCIHCGDTKKNHKPGGKCRTRLKDTKFQEWTDADRIDVGERPLGGGPPVDGPLRILAASHSVNAALRSGAKSVYGIVPGPAPSGDKRRIFAYRKPRKSTYAEGRLANGSWIPVESVEIEPS